MGPKHEQTNIDGGIPLFKLSVCSSCVNLGLEKYGLPLRGPSLTHVARMNCCYELIGKLLGLVQP